MPKSPIKTVNTKNNSPNKEIVDNTEVVSRLTSELVANPDMLAAFGRTLDSLVQNESGFIQYLPRCVKRRLKALKKIQKELFKIEEEFYLQVHCLESKYAIMKEPIHKKRTEIITALREPIKEEYDYISDEDDEEVTKRIALSNKAMGDNEKNTHKSEIDKLTTCTFTEKTLGIPDFWLTIFRNVSLLNDLIQKQDIAVLSKLKDVRVEYFNREEDVGFDLIFEFGENEYFEEKELKKSYKLRLGPDPEDQMEYEGPEIVASMETPIKWKKNITLKNKRIKRGGKRYVNKTVKTDSFFNFFCPSKNKNSESLDAEIIGDFEVGQVLKDNIIPRAFLYYTGIAFKDDEDDESSDEDDDERKESEDEEKDNITQNNAKSEDDSSDE